MSTKNLGYETTFTPAIAEFNNRIYIAYVDSDNRIAISASDSNESYQSLTYPIDKTANSSVSLCVFNGKLYMSFQEKYKNEAFGVIKITYMESDNSWAESFNLGTQTSLTSAAPSLSVSNGALYISYKDAHNNQIWYSSSVDGTNWSPPDMPWITQKNSNIYSGFTPCVIGFSGQLYLIYTDVNTKGLFITSQLTSGVNSWSVPTQLSGNQTASMAPTACVWENILFVAYNGSIFSPHLYWSSSLDGINWTPTSGLLYTQIDNAAGSPYLGVIAELVILAYADDEQTVNLSIYNSSNWTWSEPSVQKLKRFSIAFTSDPQIAYMDGNDAHLPDDQRIDLTTANVNAQYASINSLLSSGSNNLIAMVVNGDLTNTAEQKELDPMISCFNKLMLPFFPGLGNHDYCTYDTGFNHSNINRMIEFMFGKLKSTNGIINYDYSCYYTSGITQCFGSLSYSFNVGNIRLIQLQYYPTYHNGWYVFPFLNITISSSMDWLKGQLQDAMSNNEIVIINMHNYWLQGERTDYEWDTSEFNTLIAEYNVSAVFAGHIHSDCGFKQIIDGSNIPLFRCGSSIKKLFLLVTFDMTTQKFTAETYSFDEGMKTYKSINTSSSYNLIST